MKKLIVKIAKEKVINVRCTSQQQTLMRAAAAREGLGLSTWLLRLGLVAVDQRAQEERR